MCTPDKDLIRILIQGSDIVVNVHHIHHIHHIQMSHMHVLQIKLFVRLA